MPDPAVCNRCGAGKGLQAVGESCNQNCGGRVIPRPRPAAPVPPDGENPALAAIKTLGSKLCCYAGDWPFSTCDCKYGGPLLGRPGGEQTGCPELRDIYRAVAAGRAAASPDPPDMTNMCEGESPDHKPGITPAASPDERPTREAIEALPRWIAVEQAGYDANVNGPGPVMHAAVLLDDVLGLLAAPSHRGDEAAGTPAAVLNTEPSSGAASPDERLREAATDAVFACLPVLPITGSQNQGYRVSDVIDPKVIADPQEWVDAAHAICELHRLAAADRETPAGYFERTKDQQQRTLRDLGHGPQPAWIARYYGKEN